MDYSRAAQVDRDQIWLRNRTVRRLHGPPRWQGCPILSNISSRCRAQARNHRRRIVRQFRTSTSKSVDHRAGTAMRILPVGTNYASGCASEFKSQAHSPRDRRGDGRDHLPLRYLSTNHSRDRTGRWKDLTHACRTVFYPDTSVVAP
jgi:hypothetical protein